MTNHRYLLKNRLRRFQNTESEPLTLSRLYYHIERQYNDFASKVRRVDFDED